MTKAELIEAMKDFPDDTEVWVESIGITDLESVQIEKHDYFIAMPLPLEDEHKKGTHIMLRGKDD